MRFIELPLVLTVALLSFACGIITVLAVYFAFSRSERIRAWLAKMRGGQRLHCVVCAGMSSQPYIVGEWHRMPRWMGHARKGMVCSIACARAVEAQPLGTGYKILEVEDVVRWASGVPTDRGKWITAD